METQSGLYYGNLPTDAQDVLARSHDRLPTFESALIRCLTAITACPAFSEFWSDIRLRLVLKRLVSWCTTTTYSVQ